MTDDDVRGAVTRASEGLYARAADMMAGRSLPRSDDGSCNRVDSRYDTICQRTGTAPPLASVIIPTLNRSRLLVKAVESVSRQPDVPIEVVIVNDGGVEIPAPLLERIRAFHLPLTVVRHHRNLGLGASRNTGASLASGEWLMMLDDDDTLAEGGVSHLLNTARADADAAFVFGDHVRQWYEDSTPTGTEYRSAGGQRLDEFHIENPIICGSFIVKRRLFAELHGYREDLPVHEDYNLHLRILSASRAAHTSRAICMYHCRQSITRLNHRRLYWFATSAFNHAVFRGLFGRTTDWSIRLAQREYQYAHLVRGIDEGCPLHVARELVSRWWTALKSRDLAEEIALDRHAISRVCPSLAQP